VKAGILSFVAASLFAAAVAGCTGEQVASVEPASDQPSLAFEQTDLPVPVEARVAPAAQGAEGALAVNVVITPVIFVPRDQATPTPAQQASIAGALGDLQVWYRTRLGNGRLNIEGTRIVGGALTAAQYLTNNTIWSNGPAELQAALGFSPWTSGHIVLLMGVGLQGWAGGSGGGTSGFAVVGLESLINTPACAGNWWCTPTFWRGTAIHELGHALTLPHSAFPSIMDFHGDYQIKTLLNTGAWPEQNMIRTWGFFIRTLGAGQANWTSCTSDEQCLTMRCGSNGAAPSVCLPHDDYPKVGTAANWASCSEDYDCASGRCGCNGGTARVCLPTTAYPKFCTFPNWTACKGDADCATGWCGCNGGTARVCLPSTAYPKFCSFPTYNLCVGDADCSTGVCGCNGDNVKMCLPSAAYPRTCQ
jgi:hypothetical protein